MGNLIDVKCINYFRKMKLSARVSLGPSVLQMGRKNHHKLFSHVVLGVGF